MLIKTSSIRVVTLLLVGFSSPALDKGVAAESHVRLHTLRTEYQTNPLGIETQQPRLSWKIESNRRGVRQTAYRVLVASSPTLLREDQGDLWDSRKVASANNISVDYQGVSLASAQQCYWKVCIWDQDGAATSWSDPATWTMGLLQQDDWKGEWIGYDARRIVESRQADFGDAKWICHADDAPGEAPDGHRLYVAKLQAPEGAVVESAEVLAVADNKVWMAINGKMIIHGEPGWKTVKPVDVTTVLEAGVNELRFNVQNEGQGPSGLLVRLRAATESGEELLLTSDAAWLCSSSPGQHWPSEHVDQEQLRPCREIGPAGMEPWGEAELQQLFLPPVPLLRREFQVSQPVASATLFVTALGNCDAHLNGKRVSDERFTPGWTDYAKRVYYRTYDVKSEIQPGPNVLGAALADGWYSGYIGWGRNRDHYGDKPRLKMQLHLTYEDGSTDVVCTDSTWKAAVGPTLEADFLMGEKYDARQVLDNWDSASFDDADWQPVDIGADCNAKLESHLCQPVDVIQEFPPVAISEPVPGKYVFDLGQNFAGVVRLRVRGEPGQRIRLRFAERLKPDGAVYVTNLRGARATDEYICRGGEDEEWQPRFTFHGFQYVEVTGLSAPPDSGAVTGISLSSTTPRAGWFECSDSTLNRLHKNILWTQYANFIDVPTDCPQRDERLGWTGDAQVYVATACLNTDVQAFFNKWLVDLADGQRGDGQFPMVAPLVVAGDDGGPAWADAGVICPWTVYEVYRDRRVLERQYPSMKKFVEFCRKRSTDRLLPPDDFHCFGDWLSIQADTPKEVIYMTYYAHSVHLLAKSAEALGYAADAEQYGKLFEKIKRAFNDEFVDEDGRIHGDTQCCYVLALAYDLLDGERREQAAEHLVADITERNYHLSTGFVGTKDLMLVLSKIGRNDLAYRLIHNDSFPSWGFSIKQGATSIWERWDGWTPERGFQDPGMNSFAHYSFGAVYQWMAENIGGLRRLQPGYKRFEIAPQPGGELSWAKVDYESIYGRISSHWRSVDGGLHLDVAVPCNTTADIRLPTRDKGKVLLDGSPASASAEARELREEDGTVVVHVGSGNYSFFAEREK